MDYFTTLLKDQSSLTLKQLQSKILTNKTNQFNIYTLNPTIKQPQDLKIISPFYKRIDQHTQNCKCMYHKRIRSELKRMQKIKSQPLQVINKNQQHEGLPVLAPLNTIAQAQIDLSQGFEAWKQKLSAETLKDYYFEYLKTQPHFSKFKRYQELDCYNPAFEQFLKKNYLIILDRTRTQKDTKSDQYKLSQIYHNKVKTEGNLDSSYTTKFMTSLKDNQSQMSQTFINKFPSSRDGLKIKKIVFKSTGKQLELMDQDIPKNQKKQKKTTKKQFLNRSSFFGVIQDQQVIRQICSRFIHPNKSDNKEAKMMMKQLAEADIELYSKIMNDMEQNLEDGFILPNLNESHSNILVKIVLQKMSKEVQSIRRKDSIFGQKNSIIENICSRYGWGKDQKQIGLQEFWKISQSAKNLGLSRKSFGYEKDKRYRLKRSRSPFMSSTSNLKNSRISRFNRMSGISNKIGKYFFNTLNSQTDTNMSKDFLHQLQIAEQQKEQIKLKVKDEFKINSNKVGALKKGVLSTKRKIKKLSGVVDSEELDVINGLIRKETSFFPLQQEQKKLIPSNNDVKQDGDIDKNTNSSKDNDDRNSSVYSNTRNVILRHIETNKKFLKRIQNQLKGNDCEQLIIGIGTNLLTKKRKIRAIYNALQAEAQKRSPSKKHTNLLKYLQIYEQYCDLVVKMKRQKKGKPQEGQDKLSQANLQDKQGQANQINSLIQDLIKQRQLKYFSLKWLQEQQDPKQELILIIPHKQKIKEVILDKKKANITIQNTKTHKNVKNTQIDGIIIQKSLEDHVNMYFQMSKTSQKQILIEKQVDEANQQKMSNFDRKLLSYRKILKIQDKDSIYT